MIETIVAAFIGSAIGATLGIVTGHALIGVSRYIVYKLWYYK